MIYDLKLGECALIRPKDQGLEVLFVRVPGGWIVQAHGVNNQFDQDQGVFVPLNDEFRSLQPEIDGEVFHNIAESIVGNMSAAAGRLDAVNDEIKCISKMLNSITANKQNSWT